jgi:hypothetical protein
MNEMPVNASINFLNGTWIVRFVNAPNKSLNKINAGTENTSPYKIIIKIRVNESTIAVNEAELIIIRDSIKINGETIIVDNQTLYGYLKFNEYSLLLW